MSPVWKQFLLNSHFRVKAALTTASLVVWFHFSSRPQLTHKLSVAFSPSPHIFSFLFPKHLTYVSLNKGLIKAHSTDIINPNPGIQTWPIYFPSHCKRSADAFPPAGTGADSDREERVVVPVSWHFDVHLTNVGQRAENRKERCDLKGWLSI